MVSRSTIRNLLAGLSMLFCATPSWAEAPVVAAAADLQFALEEVHQQFKADTGQSLRLVFGSSGNFYRQISEGAPFQLYFSADEEYVQKLHEAGKTEDEGALYAVGRIVLMVPNGSPLKADEQLADLRAALADGRLKKFAIANPEHAPYGRRAEEALKHVGVWTDIQDKLVLGENVAQAAQFATSANAQGGIIAYSLVLSPNMAKRGQYALIPSEWHEPLKQRMVLIKGADATSQAFYRYLQEPAARAILARYGFVLPNQED
ncbi:TPA: molybdate ABC transporter substrate-binding protein [Pseudomonas aeruginosa]|uniref:molybdate ABC transporter substrate-binding protein n=1 Tax=Pseudomonas aeruginosa TaxID=287 RepID=UPI000F52521D|nr:molybdate ABC transporter substrate-binding protein [Pseudomonas aeruginosa]RPS20484.1 molybdate ABC transporter substrate-binding protein [Pseudomonas aeruginosa]RPS68430.1 molybdate ABC transporter substrate-binding protein [Pseudomonas aeruginosa]HCR1517620.1 molybdate ABC transporter substrate-binding protein [Pseudomonas aeruginosa]